MTVLTVINNKGGVGKSTVTIHGASALARRGYQVLVIDLDPQMNASLTLSPTHPAEMKTTIATVLSAEVLDDPCPWIPTIEDNLLLVPGHIDLQVWQETKGKDPVAGFTLRERLSQLALREIDLVWIDCPPDLGVLPFVGLAAATHFLVPMEAGSKYSLLGYGHLEKLVARVRRVNPVLTMLGVLLTKYDGRRTSHKAMAEGIERRVGQAPLLETTIPLSEKFKQCEMRNQTIFSLDHDSAAAIACYALGHELVHRLQLPTPNLPLTEENADADARVGRTQA